MSFGITQQIALAQRVGILTADQTQQVTIQVLGNPTAQLSGIRVLDVSTGIWYNVYPEGQPAYCNPGAGNLVIAYGVNNVGAIGGNLYGKITDSGGALLHSGAAWVAPGGTAFWEPVFNMPAEDLNLTIEVGH